MTAPTLSASGDSHALNHLLEVSATNLARSWDHLAAAGGGRTARRSGVWMADAASPCPFPNSATVLAPISEIGAAMLVDELGRFYGESAGGPWLLWSAWPTPDLSQYGLHLMGHPPLMVRPAGLPLPAAPDVLSIVAATSPSELAGYERVMVEGYPIPELAGAPAGALFHPDALGGPYRFFVGYVDGQPVSVAASYQDGVSLGIYCVATLPAFRGRGYGAALTAAACQAAPSLPAVLQASDVGRPVYERLGFATKAWFTVWVGAR